MYTEMVFFLFRWMETCLFMRLFLLLFSFRFEHNATKNKHGRCAFVSPTLSKIHVQKLEILALNQNDGFSCH